jgi:hypothetical protein
MGCENKMKQMKKASSILLLASIFMLVSAAGEIIEIFYYSSTYGYNYYEFVDFIGPVTGIVAALLFIIGFLVIRNEK